MRNQLIDLFNSDGQEAGKRYRLKIILNESSNGIALQNDATITRYNQSLEAKFVLTDAQGVELFHGEQAEQTAYNVVQSPYATLAAQQDSSKRAAQDLAERIRLQVAVWFRQHK
jgi:LPS-assembly lipoprotein